MTFFSVLLALVIEQVRALSPNNLVMVLLRGHASSVARGFTTDGKNQGLTGWLLVVLPWTVAVALVYYVLARISFALAFAWNVVIVYFTLGFRQFSHYFTDIHLALNNDDAPHARAILREWTGLDTTDMPVSEIVRHTLIHAVVASHRHVFGVFFWFLVPLGPAGAVLYRIAEYLAREWPREDDGRDAHGRNNDQAGRAKADGPTNFAQYAFFLLDWVPARLTSLGFAIVGNFEDAIYAWRNHAKQWPDANEGVLLAAGSGALGARLSGPLAEPTGLDALAAAGDGEAAVVLPVGDPCTPRTLQLAVGLVWRAVILWMLLLLMLTIAIWF